MRQGYGLSYGEEEGILFLWSPSHILAWNKQIFASPHALTPFTMACYTLRNVRMDVKMYRLSEILENLPCASEEQFYALCWNCNQHNWFSPGGESNKDLKQRPHLVNLNVVLVQCFLVRELFTNVAPQAHEFEVSSFLVLWHFCLAWSSKVTLFACVHLNQFFDLERDELDLNQYDMNMRRRIWEDCYIWFTSPPSPRCGHVHCLLVLLQFDCLYVCLWHLVYFTSIFVCLFIYLL